MVTFSEYMIFVFIASVGVLQLVAAWTKLKGLLFLKRPVLAYLLSLLAIGGSFYWFFQRDNRIDTIMRQTGLEGKQQFFGFCIAAFLAIVFTLIVSSLIGMIRDKPQSNDNKDINGLDALKSISYFEALKHSFRSKEH
jgi:hypothetical protein